MLVTLEGLDGSGKSTVWRELQSRFPDAVFTREPTTSWYGEAVVRSVDDPDADPLAELFLYCADHAAHLSETIRPALERDQLVVSDRYVDSRLAYQGATLADRLADPMGYVRAIHDPITVDPALTCYLRVDVETAIERSEGATKFERREFLAAVRSNYEAILEADEGRVVPIDAERPPEAVLEDVVAAIERARAS